MEPSPLLQPRCPDCERQFSPGQARCRWCGAELAGVSLPASASPCPVCGTGPLRGEEREGCACQACDRCGGLWMEWNAVTLLEKQFGSFAPKPRRRAGELPPLGNPLEDTPLYRKCPRCGRPMARMRYQQVSRVVVDSCFGHGVWLDRHELEHMLAFLESGGLARAQAHRTEREREEREEAKKIARILRDAGGSGTY